MSTATDRDDIMQLLRDLYQYIEPLASADVITDEHGASVAIANTEMNLLRRITDAMEIIQSL